MSDAKSKVHQLQTKFEYKQKRVRNMRDNVASGEKIAASYGICKDHHLVDYNTLKKRLLQCENDLNRLQSEINFARSDLARAEDRLLAIKLQSTL